MQFIAGVIGNEVKVDGRGQIFGGVISREFKGEGQGSVRFDKGFGLDRIEVFPSEVTIKVGETVQLTAVAKDVFGNEISCVGFEWSSSDPSVAVVDQNGLVQGVGEGRATISATAKKEGYNLAFKGETIVNVIISEVLCPFISGYSLWARVYGGQGDDFGASKRTSDGGYIIAGQTFSFGAGGGDLLVMKLDSNGNIQWQKTYGGPGRDWAYDVEETQDGGYIVGGGTGSFGAGGWDMWILKLDSYGNVQWQKTYGGWGVGIDGLNAEYVHDLAKTSDGGYIVVGGTTSYGAGDRDIWVLKLDSQGNVQWQRTYGGPLWEWSHHVEQTQDGGYIIAGQTGTFGLGFGGGGWGYDTWILKLDSHGNIQWQKTYGGWSMEWGAVIQQTSDGGYIIGGSTQSFGSGADDIWVIKLDSQGNIQWAKTYGGMGYELGGYIRQTQDGGYIVSGSTSSFGAGGWDLLALKLDPNGNIQWAKTYGGSANEYPYGAVIDQLPDGGYLLSGSTSSFGAGGYDIWVLKLDSNGDIPGCGFIASANVSVIDITSLIYVSVPNPVIGVPPFSGIDSNALIQEIDFACSLLLQCIW